MRKGKFFLPFFWIITLKLSSLSTPQIPKWNVPKFSNHLGVTGGWGEGAEIKDTPEHQKRIYCQRSKPRSASSQRRDLWLCYPSLSVFVCKMREITPTPQDCCKNYFLNRIMQVNLSGKGTKPWRGRKQPSVKMSHLQYGQKDKNGVREGQSFNSI